jgi:beta-N-acetylhexosaminidase
MTIPLHEQAHAVLLPAFGDTRLSAAVKRFLSKGGCSILVGETRAEYVAREMSPQRIQAESAQTLLTLTQEANALAGKTLVAVDQEIAGICRLHALVPAFPPREQIGSISSAEFEEISAGIALAARKLGVNCFLGPVLDIVTGVNPWLAGRTWSQDPAVVARISAAYIRGIQAQGVAAAAKHFPGFADIALDPAIDPAARMRAPHSAFEASFIPFSEAIQNGVEMVMTGPAIVEALDPQRPASISLVVIRVLREQLGFKGVVLSDDLDSQATLRGRPITQVAVEALSAGAELLLIADVGDQIDQIVSAIVKAVKHGDLAETRLTEAAGKVRALGAKYSL